MSFDRDASDSMAAQVTPRRVPGRRFLRRMVSVWLVFHCAAIIVSPAAVAPSSELVQKAWGWFQPYTQFLYLNHGYHFFAPSQPRVRSWHSRPVVPTGRSSGGGYRIAPLNLGCSTTAISC